MRLCGRVQTVSSARPSVQQDYALERTMVCRPKHVIVVATLAIIGSSVAQALTPVESKQIASFPLRHFR